MTNKHGAVKIRQQQINEKKAAQLACLQTLTQCESIISLFSFYFWLFTLENINCSNSFLQCHHTHMPYPKQTKSITKRQDNEDDVEVDFNTPNNSG
jgi:hypothetical protein